MQREKVISALRGQLSGKRRPEKEEEPIVQSHFERSLAWRRANPERNRLVAKGQIREKEKLVT